MENEMNVEHEIGSMLKEFFDSITQEEPKEIPVGTASKEIQSESLSIKNDMKILNHQLKARKEELLKEATEKLKTEFDPQFEMLDNRHKEMWNIVVEELKLDRKKVYVMDKNTGEVRELEGETSE